MVLKTLHGDLSLPAFLPDGTVGVVRSVDSTDLESAKVSGVVVSTFHLLVHSVSVDLHSLMSYQKPILTDSGGFQIYSLLRDHPDLGKLSRMGFEFLWNGQKIVLTPEQSIRLQLKLGADILICLDQCTEAEGDFEFQKEAVDRTIEWAKKCKEEFKKLIANKQDTKNKVERPKLFVVIQGGDNKELRKYCAQELIKIGFDGYCYGGWPVNQDRKLLDEILEYTASLMPNDKPKYALGVGKPQDIIKCVKWGYNLFDCVIPTREARHKKLYVFKKSAGSRLKHPKGVNLSYEAITVNTKFSASSLPISKLCDCYTCQNFARAYLYHLFKIGDTLAYRLATIHNLRFYSELLERIRLPNMGDKVQAAELEG